MFEDIIKSKQKNIIYTNATVTAGGKEYNIKAYGVRMTAGTVVGFIEDDTRKIDGYTDYEMSIPLAGKSYSRVFTVMVVRTSPDTLKFYSPGAE